MDISGAAEKEINRMNVVFGKLEFAKKSALADEFYDFAKRYFEDGKYFYKNEKFIEAFEAEIISWAYIDAGLKLGFFNVPKELRKVFTIGE